MRVERVRPHNSPRMNRALLDPGFGSCVELPMRSLGLALLAIALLARTAAADDEASEHTAHLVGDPKDTLGVTVAFADKTGWSMTVRAKPGADQRTHALALPLHHAHYLVYVAPGRSAITFVEISAGISATRRKLDPKDTLAWVWSPAGKLVRSWRYGQVLTAKQLANPQRSKSHLDWNDGFKLTAAGLELPVADGSRTAILARDASTLR
jgi:hypothetical protein